MARTKRRGDRKIPTSTSFGSAPPLSASEFGAFRHGFFYSVWSVCAVDLHLLALQQILYVFTESHLMTLHVCCRPIRISADIFRSIDKIESIGLCSNIR